MDIGVSGGKIVAVGPSLPTAEARRTCKRRNAIDGDATPLSQIAFGAGFGSIRVQ